MQTKSFGFNKEYMMTHSALQVANEIIKEGRAVGLQFTQMQLLKLVYIAHGWYLAATNTPLIGDEIQAWKYGPVIPNLYSEISKYGSNPIPGEILCVDGSFDSTSKRVINFVVRNYGKLSAFKLSEITHGTNTPWSKTYGFGWAESIPDSEIMQHYKDLSQKYFGKK